MKSFALAALVSAATAQNLFEQIIGDAIYRPVSDAQEMPLPISTNF